VDGQVRVRSIVMYVVGLVVLASATTGAFLAMRDVLAIGGSCASGGPYEVAVPCPEGTAVLIVGGIFGWLVGAGITLVAGSNLPGDYGTVAALAWPGLFLSFGWNFLEFGLDPADGGGVNGGMVFCGVLFFLMGGVPLVLGIKGLARGLWPPATAAVASTGTAPAPAPRTATVDVARPVDAAPVGSTQSTSAGAMTPSPTPPEAMTLPPQPPAGTSARAQPGREDIVGELERLAGLRASGALDGDEYERAKDILLGRTGEDAR
jgi:hypothetical protein